MVRDDQGASIEQQLKNKKPKNQRQNGGEEEVPADTSMGDELN